MRIGLFSDYYFSKGDGTAIATRISKKGLRRVGHQTIVFCPRLVGQPQESDVVSFKSWPGWLYPGLRLCWPFSRGNLAEVERKQLDIIHLETPIFVGLLGLWAARRLRLPSVMTVHLDMDFMGGYIFRLPALGAMALLAAVISRRIDKNFWRMLWPRRVDRTKRRSEDFAWRTMAFTASRADLAIVPSKKNYNQLVKYVDKARVRLVPNGIDLPSTVIKQSLARARLGLEPNDFVVIVTARHVKEKRVEMAISSFARFAARRPDAKLLILNEGPLTPQLKKLAAELGLPERVIFAGLVEHNKVFDYLSASDVFINASMREVISLGVLEAATSGLALLLCDKRLSEPLDNGVNGYFVKDQKELSARLEALYKNRDVLNKFSEASRKKGTVYSVESHTKALLSVYSELTERD